MVLLCWNREGRNIGGVKVRQQSDPAAIIWADEPMAVRLYIRFNLITSQKKETAMKDTTLPEEDGTNSGPDRGFFQGRELLAKDDCSRKGLYFPEPKRGSIKNRALRNNCRSAVQETAFWHLGCEKFAQESLRKHRRAGRMM